MNTNAFEAEPAGAPADAARVGDVVMLFRGAPLGVVRKLARGGFQVASGDLLIWIRNDAILARTREGVRLLCDRATLHLYAGRGVPSRATSNLQTTISAG